MEGLNAARTATLTPNHKKDSDVLHAQHDSRSVGSLYAPQHPVAGLQTAYGNRAVQQMLASLIRQADAVSDDHNNSRSLAGGVTDQSSAQRSLLRQIPIHTLQRNLGNRVLARFFQRTRPAPRAKTAPANSQVCLVSGRAVEPVVHEPVAPRLGHAVVQRQPTPPSQPSPPPSQTAAAPTQLTQALYDQAVAKLPAANADLVRILGQGKVGQRVQRVQVTTSALPASPSPSTTNPGPAVTFVFDLLISPDAGQLTQGVYAEYVDAPASPTGTPATGQTFTQLLQIVTKAPSGPTASSDLASALMHEGTHMLLALDKLLKNLDQDPRIAAGMTGTLKTFEQYRQAGNRSTLRATLVAGLVSEINRVRAVPSAAQSPPTPGPSTVPPTPSAPSTLPLPSAGSSSAQIAADVIDGILEELFAVDQQQRANVPQSRPVNKGMIAQAYLFPVLLPQEAGIKSWPNGPSRASLVQSMAAFLNDVSSLVASSQPGAPSGGKSIGPSPSPTPVAPPPTTP